MPMTCHETQPRLVAFQDDELCAEEASMVKDHLDDCLCCRRLESELAQIEPRPSLVVPPSVVVRLQERVDEAMHEALHAAPTEPQGYRWFAWLRRDAQMPTGTVLAYVLLLFMVFGWGISNWWSLNHLRNQVVTGEATTEFAPADPTIPAEQYQPASYTTTGDEFH
ncbi:MAG: zf-HC2 domain-containing protein [Proteobacteria bacterium]|jgi:hypothetical protein|nr:zf-HC2 domain-containing protein [Pseudomonadota bacterium]